MAELLFTTDAFCPLGQSVSGVPMILDADMRLIEPACTWLMHIALVRGRTRSRQTWRTYGEALYDWWQTLEANGWAWDQITYHEIAAYRDNMLTACSEHTGQPYARATINGRLRIIALFYRWCLASSLIAKMPFTSQEVSVARWRPAPFLAHADARGGMRTANELILRNVRALPCPLAPELIRRIMAPLSTRDRLIIEWAAMTGMRRMEIAGLQRNVLALAEPAAEFASSPVIAIRLDVTKGDRARQVYPPLPLVDRTRAYVNEERAAVVNRARWANPSYRDPGNLFLTVHGRPMSPRRVGAMFAAASHAAGADATFHRLRHTFAGAMLRMLQRQAERNPDMNPLLILQAVLGHADLTTTAIYLRMVAIDLEAIETAVDNLFSALG